MLGIHIDTTDLERKAYAFTGILTSHSRLALTLTGIDVKNSLGAGTYWKNRTGKTAASFQVRLGSGLTMSVSSRKKSALYLEHGTKAHGPVTAKALRFKIGGITFFRKWVKGITPRHYAAREADRAGTHVLPGLLTLARDRAIAQAGLG